ncbi:amidohydrolase [Croceicoccus sp. Ery5]|uniref:amidohydrolase family protein n=1 Tax=Croceicoccus sp. Ery5 TaxID=1703340 RepID=UPI001E505CE7|nr:amidohydrolase family protein [Croceicoccus sp. Ery5]
MIIDSQIHLWEADNPARPWPEGVKPDVAEPLTAERFIPMMDEIGVDRAIIAPPGVCGFDPGYALECAARFPDRLAVTSRWTLDDPEWRASLPTWMDRPGMVGIRLGLLPAARHKWQESGDLGDFWAECERLGIPLMIFAPRDLSAVEQAAEAHPGLTLVVDHVNLVISTPDTVADCVAELNLLARFPNVAVKLGSLPLRSAGGYPYADLHAPLQSVYDAFGAERLMWASDQTTTMARDRGSYLENLMLMRDAYAAVPKGDLDMILGGTVARLFPWRS